MKKKQIALLVILITILIAVLPFFLTTVINEDLYGRLSETKNANHLGMPSNSSSELPTIRLVLHKMLLDENAIEVSVIIYVTDNKIVDLVKNGTTSMSAIIRDGNGINPYGIGGGITLNKLNANPEPGSSYIAVQSNRFLLPTSPSVDGFPFDDIKMIPIVDFRNNGLSTYEFNFEVQKSFPGRLIEVINEKDYGRVIINLTRTTSEKSFIIISSLIFLVLTILISYGIITLKKGLGKTEELIAFAGYLIAIAGFRELIGLSRVNGISSLEVIVIGIPLIVLFSAILVSFIKGNINMKKRN